MDEWHRFDTDLSHRPRDLPDSAHLWVILEPDGLPEVVALQAARLVTRTLRDVVGTTPQQARVEQR